MLSANASLAEYDELGRDDGCLCGSDAEAAVRACFEGLELVDADILPAARSIAGNDALDLRGDL